MASNYLVPPQSHVAWSQLARPLGGLEQVRSGESHLHASWAMHTPSNKGSIPYWRYEWVCLPEVSAREH